jgi:multiple sugar transport system substrate-binding protein
LQGEIPLWYTGSWSAQAVIDAHGDDAVFLPPPDFGTGPKIGAGSWQLGVTTNCPEEATQGAFDYVLFTMEPKTALCPKSSLIPTRPRQPR